MSTDPKRWVAGHVAALPKSGIRDFFELVAKMKGQDVISLGVGEPDFVTPWHIREAAIFALEHGKTYYTSNLGLIELRRAISTYVEEHFAVSYRPDDQIIVTVGVSEALDLACRAFINPGEKVMFHQPCYVSYHPSISLTHGQGIAVPTYAKDNFALTAEALRAWCAERLSDYKVPETMDLTAEPLPRNANGKVMKRQLREAWAAAQ